MILDNNIKLYTDVGGVEFARLHNYTGLHTMILDNNIKLYTNVGGVEFARLY